MALYGIDVSYAQGNIDWSQVATVKDFAIIRAGYGANNIDSFAQTNVQQATGNNIPVGLYWFSYAYTAQMAEQEGDYISQFAQAYNIAYPLYFDFEYDSISYAQSHGVTVTAQLLYDMMDTFCTKVESYGYNSGVYYNPDFFNRFNMSVFFNDYPLRSKWVASWGGTPPSSYDIWQYQVGSAGSVPGITTAIDLDIIGSSPVPPTPTPTFNKMPIWMYLRRRLG